MGMAASQARLLTITARLHDVEYQAQSIQNAKISLATQQDDVYQKYLDALDATTLTYKTDEGYVAATFDNLCGFNNITNGTVALRDNRGALIVPDDIYRGYKNFRTSGGDNNAYQFAVFMMDAENSKNAANNPRSIHNAEHEAYQRLVDNTDFDHSDLEQIRKKILTEVLGFNDEDESGADYSDPASIYDTDRIADDKDKQKLYKELMATYLQKLYTATYKTDDTSEICTGAALIYELTEDDSSIVAEELDLDTLNYYIEYYNKIQACGGMCVSIEDDKFTGTALKQDAKNASDWLQDMVKSGQISIEQVKPKNVHGVSVGLSMTGTAPSSDTNISYTETTKIDSRALKKAELEYEKDMKAIDKKDKAYDMTLSKLETQREALKTEYDQIKNVIKDNIDRSFGIFS